MKILIIAEHKNGQLTEATQELFGLSLGQAEVHAVVTGEGVEPLAARFTPEKPRPKSSSPTTA